MFVCWKLDHHLLWFFKIFLSIFIGLYSVFDFIHRINLIYLLIFLFTLHNAT